MQPLLVDLLGKNLSCVSTAIKPIVDPTKLANEEYTSQLGVEYTRKVGLLVLGLIKHTFQDLLDQKYQKCDALVGETSCQLRAAYIAENVPKYLNQREKLLATIAEGGRLAKILLEEKSTELSGNNVAQTLAAWSEKRKATPIVLDETDRYLILAHLLTTIRDSANPLTTNFNNLNFYLSAHQLQLEDQIAKNLVFHVKSQLSRNSIGYMKATAVKLQAHNLWVMSSRKQVLDVNHQGLYCSPCYYSCGLLTEQIQRLKCPIILIIDHEKEEKILSSTKLVLSYEEGNRVKLIKSASGEEVSRPCVVLRGISRQDLPAEKVIEGILGKEEKETGWDYSKIEELVSAAAVKHPQYAGAKKDKGIPLYSENSFLNIVDSLRKKITTITKEEVAKHLRQENQGAVKAARIECDHGDLNRLDHVTLLSEVIAAKLKMEKTVLLAEEKKLGELSDGSPRPQALYALKHIYNLSLLEGLKDAWKGGEDNEKK
jgi:hypothetical protein